MLSGIIWSRCLVGVALRKDVGQCFCSQVDTLMVGDFFVLRIVISEDHAKFTQCYRSKGEIWAGGNSWMCIQTTV